MAKFRQQKIDEEMKRELSAIISELKDPRLEGLMLSVVLVEVTRDLRFAKAHVSVWGEEARMKDAMKGLNSAAPFVRREIGARLNLRYTPQISFVRDTTIAYGAHINKVLSDLDLESKEENHEEDN